jgi:RNA polymerase sigma-70 factor (ECF subfamily)
VSSDLERRRRFEEVAAEVHDPLQRYLRRRASIDDADEVFGDVLLTIWRRLDAVPRQAVLPWCYGVARRHLANKRRSAVRHLRLVERIATVGQPELVFDPFEGRDHPELADAMLALSEAEREVVTLWAWEQLEPREIAVVLDTTPNAVSLKLSRAKAKLADRITRQTDTGAGHIPDASTEEHRA